jgi:hypothetical protein
MIEDGVWYYFEILVCYFTPVCLEEATDLMLSYKD